MSRQWTKFLTWTERVNEIEERFLSFREFEFIRLYVGNRDETNFLEMEHAGTTIELYPEGYNYSKKLRREEQSNIYKIKLGHVKLCTRPMKGIINEFANTLVG
jgi:hypothetical protein